jgi:hypothetical protein
MNVADNEAREQVQRLIESELFQSSELQRRLLRYLAEKSRTGEADQLKEYTVGIEAAGKPASYDPRIDSTVRLQIARLRQRIVEYYLGAGQADPVLIDFPKGHFKMVFSRREPAPAPVPGPAPRKWRRIALVSLCALAAMAALYIQQAVSLVRLQGTIAAGSQTLPPALNQFWGPLIANRKPTLICIGAPMFLYSFEMGLYRDPRVNNWEAAESSGLVSKLKRAFPSASAPVPWYVFTGLGEAGGAFMLGRLLSPRIPDLRLTDSSTVPWGDIRDDNVVFLGAPKFNRQIDDLPVRQELFLELDGIRNAHPHPGEPAVFEDLSPQGQNGLSYALITRLPGLHGEGFIVALAGQGIPGTLAATQFVTSDTYAADMMKHLASSSGKAPPYYQVVIKAKFNHWVPVELSYVLHHALEPGAGTAH